MVELRVIDVPLSEEEEDDELVSAMKEKSFVAPL